MQADILGFDSPSLGEYVYKIRRLIPSFQRTKKSRESESACPRVVSLISELKRKPPLKYFHDASLMALIEVAATSEHKKNDELFSIGDKDKTAVFLIRGSVTLESIDGRLISIDHNHSMAQFALANLKPRLYKAKTTSDDTVLFWVKDEILDITMSENLQSQEIAVADGWAGLANLARQPATS